MILRNRILRIAAGALAAEVLAVILLVLLVGIAGPSDPPAAQAYAKRLGLWVGPVGGFIFTLLAAWWVARGLQTPPLTNGIIVGVAVAAIDVSILILSGAGFDPIFAISNAGRVIAGLIGGWLAGRSATRD